MDGPGFMLTFCVHGGAARADALLDALALLTHATSLGAVETTLERRARYPAERDVVPEDLLRVSVGCEHVEDLWADLAQALEATAGGVARRARAAHGARERAQAGLRAFSWYTDVYPTSKPWRAARRYSRQTRSRCAPASRSASTRCSSRRSCQWRRVDRVIGHEALDVLGAKARPLEGELHAREQQRLAVGEHVAIVNSSASGSSSGRIRLIAWLSTSPPGFSTPNSERA